MTVRSHAVIVANPNPILVFDRSEVGVTTLRKEAVGVDQLEVRINSPSGVLLAKSGPTGSCQTGSWVRDGMTFYLQDASVDRPPDPHWTLATVRVHVCQRPFMESVSRSRFAQENRSDTLSLNGRRALVAGWFSFGDGGGTAGDLMARDLVCSWLESGGCTFDCALESPFIGGVQWHSVDPKQYHYLIFVCGPVDKDNPQLAELFARFSDSVRIGINLSLSEPLEQWNPFRVLFERDSSRCRRPDITFLSQTPQIPTVGLILRDPITIHVDRNRHHHVHEALRELLSSLDVATVEIDTRLDLSRNALRSAAAVESLVARMDVIITTRLHGLVFALKHGIPVLAIDPIAGGSNVYQQAEAVGWPIVFLPEELGIEELRTAFARCLTDEAKALALQCHKRAVTLLDGIADDFLSALDTY